MKIVGLLNDEDELNEMENIAKIFIVEQRMKNLSYIKIVKPTLEKKYSHSSEKIILNHNNYLKRLSLLTVRGLQ